MGAPEQRVVDGELLEPNTLLDLLDRVIIDVDFLFPVVTGKSKATEAEFKALAQVLGITDNVSTVEHSTKVPQMFMRPIH